MHKSGNLSNDKLIGRKLRTLVSYLSDIVSHVFKESSKPAAISITSPASRNPIWKLANQHRFFATIE